MEFETSIIIIIFIFNNEGVTYRGFFNILGSTTCFMLMELLEEIIEIKRVILGADVLIRWEGKELEHIYLYLALKLMPFPLYHINIF